MVLRFALSVFRYMPLRNTQYEKRVELYFMNEKKLHIHFIGVGGSGMSGLASILLDSGHKISGSDIATSKITKRLADKGATIFKGHNEDNVEGADLIVVSSASRYTR